MYIHDCFRLLKSFTDTPIGACTADFRCCDSMCRVELDGRSNCGQRCTGAAVGLYGRS